MKNADNIGDCSILYRTLRKVTDRNRVAQNLLRDDDGVLLTATAVTLKWWQGHFSEILNGQPSATPPYVPSTSPYMMYKSSFDLPTLEDVTSCKRDLKCRKVTGEDGIVSEWLKANCSTLQEEIHRILCDI